jgi:hypothetical protein
MSGRDPDVSQRNPGIERRHDESGSEHAWMHGPQTGPLDDRADPSVRISPVKKFAAVAVEDQTLESIPDGQVEGPSDPRNEGITAGLLPLPKIRKVRCPRSKPRSSASVAQALLTRIASVWASLWDSLTRQITSRVEM